MLLFGVQKTIIFLLLAFVWEKVICKPIENEIEININDNEIVINKNEQKIVNHDKEYRIEYAKKIMMYMNETIDPCDDFYEYACGNWKNVIEEHQTQHKRSNLIDIEFKLMEAVDLLLLLQQKSAENLKLDYGAELKLAQLYYQSCLEADLYPMKKSQVYLEVIKSIGGFPAVDNSTWNASNFSWFNMSAHLNNYGAAGLVNEHIVPQYPFPPYFKLPDLGFDLIVHSDNIISNTSRGYVLNEKRMREYLTTYDVEEIKITEVINDIFEFWRAVLTVFDEFDEDLNKCQELSANETEIFKKWDDYYVIAWNNTNFNLSDFGCPCDFFYVRLDKICNEHKIAVANYLAMKFLYGMDSLMKDKKYQKEYCVQQLKSALPFLIDKLYLEEYFSEDISKEITTIIEQLRRSVRETLEKADWLDEVTRTEALQKESTVISRVGNFNDTKKTEKLIREMNNLVFVENNYELNNINLKKFEMYMKRYNGLHFHDIAEDTKPLELLIGMQTNAFYYNIDNSINVMAGILLPPAYHKAWPNSLKFGTIGFLVGHEFTHGFDTVGANYDSKGDERYWWTHKSGKVFEERTKCFVDHYNSYLIPEINRPINGNETKDENIADNGGLRNAYSAYRRHMKDLSKETGRIISNEEEQLPGLNLTPEQLFFMGFAQLWCSSYAEEHYWEELTNEHTIDKYRTLGALTNNAEFAEAYNCPLGSKMNPGKHKCHMW